MREAIKGYHMFLPGGWLKWCIYLLYPLCVIGGMYAMNRYLLYFAQICVGLTCCILVAVEMCLDTYVFLGIGARDTNRLEYLKTSAKGMPLLKKALVMDGIRRFLSMLVMMIGLYFIAKTGNAGEAAFSLPGSLLCAMLVFAMIEFAFVFTRLSTNVWLNMVVLYLLGGAAFAVGIELFGSEIQIWMLPAGGAAGLAAAMAGRGRIIKRAEESYYDSEIKEAVKDNRIRH